MTFEPGQGPPRILFVGWPHSSHTHSWIDLVSDSDFDVRLFALPGAIPPRDWPVHTYVTKPRYGKREANWTTLYAADPIRKAAKWAVFSRLGRGATARAERWLAEIVRSWKPAVIHTLGLDPAGFFFLRARSRFDLAGLGKWVLQLRGGSDLTLRRLDPDIAPVISDALRACDQLLSDNPVNYEYAFELGLRRDQVASLGTVPGTGGVDVGALAVRARQKPSTRRAILWPKAYDSQWSLALPCFEALRLAWDQIQPCEVYMLSMSPETRQWFRTLPPEITAQCHTEDRLPRERTLALMGEARVMFAPSLVDGTPNTLFEAMATGALPIVSPLDTIRPLVRDGENVLFARNLYPDEMAEALHRAMVDDELVDMAAARNLELVRRLADRREIRERVLRFYEGLAVPGDGSAARPSPPRAAFEPLARTPNED